MPAANGSLGGIAIVPEVTYGTTPGTPSWVWQHPMNSTLGLRRPTVEPNLISYAAHSARGYAGAFVDGDVAVGLGKEVGGDLDDDLLGPALATAGTYSTDHWILGDGSAPDGNSVSVLMSYGGGVTYTGNFEYIHSGIKPNAIRFDLSPDNQSSMTMVCVGQGTQITAGGSASDPSPPAESTLFMPSDLGTVEILTNTVCLYSATFEVLVPKTGFDRRCMGGVMKEPITAGRPDITFTLNCDLDDSTGNETSTVLAAFIGGADLGTITIGTDFVLNGCVMSGDFPPLQNGQIDFSISGTASSLEVYTT